MQEKYTLGTTYQTRGKFPRTCTVVDVLKTFNLKGGCVKLCYVSKHTFLGQEVYNYDVPQTTIDMGKLNPVYSPNYQEVNHAGL